MKNFSLIFGFSFSLFCMSSLSGFSQVFSGVKHTFEIDASKNEAFSADILISDLKGIENVKEVRYNSSTKVVTIFAEKKIIFPVIRKRLRNQSLNLKDLKEEEIYINDLKNYDND